MSGVVHFPTKAAVEQSQHVWRLRDWADRNGLQLHKLPQWRSIRHDTTGHKFFIGPPCKRGHKGPFASGAIRFVRGHECFECHQGFRSIAGAARAEKLRDLAKKELAVRDHAKALSKAAKETLALSKRYDKRVTANGVTRGVMRDIEEQETAETWYFTEMASPTGLEPVLPA